MSLPTQDQAREAVRILSQAAKDLYAIGLTQKDAALAMCGGGVELLVDGGMAVTEIIAIVTDSAACLAKIEKEHGDRSVDVLLAEFPNPS